MTEIHCRRCHGIFGCTDKELVCHLRYFHNDIFKKYISELGPQDLKLLNKALDWDIKYDSMSRED